LPKSSGPTQKRCSIKKVADKRKEENLLYKEVTKPEYLAKHPNCELGPAIIDWLEKNPWSDWWPSCTGKAVELHHIEGRENELLNDVNNLKAACQSKDRPYSCHNWVEEFGTAAIEIGLSKPRRSRREILYKK
jgi:hypothetical protein